MVKVEDGLAESGGERLIFQPALGADHVGVADFIQLAGVRGVTCVERNLDHSSLFCGAVSKD